jgi:trans-aconitate methyltransferase
MIRKDHWNTVYSTKAPDDVSWFQSRPEVSLQLIERTGVTKHEPLIDVGGGASTLVDYLLEAGHTALTVLDISGVALEQARHRLGSRASRVQWIEADVTAFIPPRSFALWHDRAVFHFLTDPDDRRKYRETLAQAVAPHGHVIIAAFALDGPTQCSGLEVVRYDAARICAELGAAFELKEQVVEMHHTPWDTTQSFTYFRFQRADR